VSRTRGAAALGLVLLLTACHGQQQEPAAAGPARPPLQVRHDTGELARTFPALGAPVSASWLQWDNTTMTGIEPDQNAPTTQVVWIDAVVQVAPSVMKSFVTQHETRETTLRPAVQKPLEAAVPRGPFRSGVEINMLFGGPGVSTRVFLDPPENTVVLQSYRLT
jgi:hypothetical protein